jgi:hypothetical protein
MYFPLLHRNPILSHAVSNSGVGERKMTTDVRRLGITHPFNNETTSDSVESEHPSRIRIISYEFPVVIRRIESRFFAIIAD